jgi:hypothetical protein
VGLAAPVSPNPTSSSPAGNADDERKFAGSWNDLLPCHRCSAKRISDARERAAKSEIFRGRQRSSLRPPATNHGAKLGDNPIVDWGFRYRSTRKPRLSCHRRTQLALMERFQT